MDGNERSFDDFDGERKEETLLPPLPPSQERNVLLLWSVRYNALFRPGPYLCGGTDHNITSDSNQ